MSSSAHDHSFDGEVIDDEAFSYVCGLDRHDDPLEDPSCWPKVNPLLGVTITEEYLAGVVRQARAMPGKLNGVLRLHVCVWTDAEEAWMSRKALEADYDPAEHQEKPVYVGIDLICLEMPAPQMQHTTNNSGLTGARLIAYPT